LDGKVTWWRVDERLWSVRQSLWILSCGITFAGLALTIWSRLALGRNWSASVTYREGHALILKGPYRYVRHPIYTGLISMISGTAIVVGSVGGLIAIVVFILGTWWKLKKEEALMTQYFPDEYQHYKSRTKALIPFVL
jgi:protein-S-isoprenylcysteine O-methyltransferase